MGDVVRLHMAWTCTIQKRVGLPPSVKLTEATVTEIFTVEVIDKSRSMPVTHNCLLSIS